MKNERRTTQSQRPWWEGRGWEEQDESDSTSKADLPLVLVEHGAKGTRISAPSPQAMALGLWPDMKLADARTMVPLMRVETHDKMATAAAHARLAHWMLRWSPAIAPYGDDGFLLDTTGCDHLFGSEQAMAQDICSRLSALGFTARVAFADTVGAAIAVVDHAVDQIMVLATGHAKDALDALPVEALRLDGDSLVLLKRLGLKLVGDVRPLPRAALERRFRERGAKAKKTLHARVSQSVQMRLDQLSGVLAEPLTFITPPSAFRAVRQCPELAIEQGAVEIALDHLLDDVCASLEREMKGGRMFRLTAYRADGGTGSAQVRLSQAVRDKAMVQRLFRERLEQIDCGFGIDLFVLDVGGVERLGLAQNDMMDVGATRRVATELTAFADTVANRVGKAAVVRFTPRASHVPERAQQAMPLVVGDRWQHWQKPVQAPRPLRLLVRPEPALVTAELPDSPPVQFVWRKVLRKVIRSRGPERILPEWWSDDLKAKQSATFRDYYDVEDARGLRYWLFRSIHDLPIAEPHSDGPQQGLPPGWDHGDRLQNPPIDTQPVHEVETVRRILWFVHGLF